MNPTNESLEEEAYRKHREHTPLINLNAEVHPNIDNFIEQQNYYNELCSRSDQLNERLKNGMGGILKIPPAEQLIMLNSFSSESKQIRLDLQVLRSNYTNAYNAFYATAKQDEDVMYEFRKLSPWLVIENNKKWIETSIQKYETLIAQFEPQIKKVTKGEEESKNPHILQNAHFRIATFFKYHKLFLKTMEQHNKHVLRWDKERKLWKTPDEHLIGITAYLQDSKKIYADVVSVLANYFSSYDRFREEGKKNPRVMHEFRRVEKALPADGMKNINAQFENIKTEYERMIRKREKNLLQLKEPQKRKKITFPNWINKLIKR